MTTDLVAFVRARIDEDEQAAQPAAEDAEQLDEWQNAFDAPRGRFAPHLRRHTPARVLAQVAAMRRIVDEHPSDDAGFCGDGIGLVGCKWAWPCPTLRALASTWHDHPDYRQEWHP